MKIYLAAPVFSQCQRQYNRHLAEAIAARVPRCEFILPQDFRLGPGNASYNDRRRLAAIHQRCLDSIKSVDVILALLDGADADSGVAYEVGFARGIGKPVLGLRTDYRQLQVKGLNVMLAEGCTDVLCHFSFDERLDALAEAVVPHLERLTERPKNSPGAAVRRVRSGK